MKTNKQNINFIAGRTWAEVILLLINDLVGFGFSIALVSLIREWLFVNSTNKLFDPNVIRTSIILVVFSIVVLAAKGLYPGRGRVSVVELKQVFDSIVVAYAIVGVIIFVQGTNVAYSRSVFVLSGILSFGIISVGRFLIRKIIAKFSWWGEPVVLIGLESKIIEVSNKLLSCPRLGFRPVIGLAIDSKEGKSVSKIPIKPWSINLQKAVHNSNITTNILAVPTDELKQDYPSVYRSVGLSFPKTIFIMNDIFGSMMAQPLDINGQPAMESRQALLNPLLRLLKMVFEIISSLFVLFPVLFICLFISIIIKLDSPGPVLYTQERIGQHLKPFRFFKFRTMFINSDAILSEMLKDPDIKDEWEEFHKITNDQRITRVGKWIRKFSLDELPQFLNILRGEMSLIGPRPLVQAEIDKIGEAAELIFYVKPGLTGWWQVNGRNNLSFEERTQLDLFYVFNWSLWLDLFIFIKTFWISLVDRSGM